VATRFLCCEPWAGGRWVAGTARRPTADGAPQSKHLVEVRYPDAAGIALGMDHLNTHPPAARYEVFPPTEAKRLADTREIHDPPQQGSWLNLAELERSGLSRQGPDRRVPAFATRPAAGMAGQERRTAAGGTMDWRFTTAEARFKLQRLYPSVHE
jgi:hypothetical protein